MTEEKNALGEFYCIEVNINDGAFVDDKHDYELGYALETQWSMQHHLKIYAVLSLLTVPQLAGITEGNKVRRHLILPSCGRS